MWLSLRTVNIARLNETVCGRVASGALRKPHACDLYSTAAARQSDGYRRKPLASWIPNRKPAAGVPEREDFLGEGLVSVDDGEVILYWDVEPKQASKLLKLLRDDLASLDAEEFFDKWLDADAEDS